MRSDQAGFQWAVHEALHYAERAIAYVGDMSAEEFARNLMAVDAVTRCIEVIGEAAVRAKKASAEIYAAHPELMFDDLRDARNAAIHEYERIDAESLFLTVQDAVKPVAEACRAFLGNGKDVQIARLVLKMHDRQFEVPPKFWETLDLYADERQLDVMHREIGKFDSLNELLDNLGIVIPGIEPG